MKKLIFTICIMTVLSTASVYAVDMQYEKIPEDTSIPMTVDDSDIYPVLREMGRNKYLVEINGEKYYAGDRFNKNEPSLPIKASGEHPSSTDCVWTGEGYYVRETNKDGYWPNAHKYAGRLRLYDTGGNLIKQYELATLFDPKAYGQHACEIGYDNGTYYAKLMEEGPEHSSYYKPERVIKSTDFVNWTETDEKVPRNIGNIRMKNNKIAVENSQNYYDIIRENYPDLELFYMLGDYLIYRDDDGNLYFSNDGVYLLKIDYPEELNAQDKVERTHYAVQCTYETQQEIVIDMYKDRESILQIKLPKNELYTGISEMQDAAYVVFGEKLLGFETPPVIENDYTLVPMRFLFEQMGADVEWDQETMTATATKNNTAVAFSINDTNAEVNGTTAAMDVPARLINDKTMVPLRFLSEEMGYTVTWDDTTRTAIIE